ncbi:MAG: M61 family peptidase [Bacteroidetes bacterium]|nr:M61 family peptidase [Bacteroidota bacterium]PHX82042.1 MAG: peptidase M61 [Flavobacteriales bacterium]
MIYKISSANPSSRYLQVEATIENSERKNIEIQLPAWRPGRYELGNFSKNVRNLRVYDSTLKELKVAKNTKDCWSIASEGKALVTVRYDYFANELNAGSTFVDDSQIYVNPVNCLIYNPAKINEECSIELDIPSDWEIACALKTQNKNILVAPNYDRLADSPFIASKTLKKNKFEIAGVEFNLWFQGPTNLDWPKIIADFSLFTAAQMELFGSFPSSAYHFIFQILPHRFYHGVEHTESTVIALGPAYMLMEGDTYNDFLGVSCHELFHAWNIKAIRPAEMLPYDFTKENYSRLGFVTEGVTTYYGDYLLFRSSVWGEEDFWPAFNERMDHHFESHARYFQPVSEASFDSWLDGYVIGAPHRKTSIYHEGCLLAFVTDMFIRKNTENKKSLDSVMKRLWMEFALKGNGYTEADYKRIIEEEAGADFSYYWDNYFYKANSYETILVEALSIIGCDLIFVPSNRPHEHYYGFKVVESMGLTKVSEIYYGSPAEKNGLAVGDEIIAVNEMQVKVNMAEWINYFAEQAIEIIVASGGKIKTIQLIKNSSTYFANPRVLRKENSSNLEIAAWESWSGKSY